MQITSTKLSAHCSKILSVNVLDKTSIVLKMVEYSILLRKKVLSCSSVEGFHSFLHDRLTTVKVETAESYLRTMEKVGIVIDMGVR